MDLITDLNHISTLLISVSRFKPKSLLDILAVRDDLAEIREKILHCLKAHINEMNASAMLYMQAMTNEVTRLEERVTQLEEGLNPKVSFKLFQNFKP